MSARAPFSPRKIRSTFARPNSEFAVLDEVGRDLPSTHDRGFRQYARTLKIRMRPESSTYELMGLGM
jgi:hypothetical protein